jgi:large repetitive protein
VVRIFSGTLLAKEYDMNAPIKPVPLGLTLLIVMALLLSSALAVTPVTAADTIMVTNLYDSGAGSLRQAIADIPSNGIITFDSSLSGQTIPLSSTLVINKTMDINGGMLDLPIKISGGDAVRVFHVNTGVTATLINLKISNGYSSEAGDAGSGGGIRNYGTLTLLSCTITDNQSAWNGGGIRNNGTLVLENSIISTNQAEGFGGGVQNTDTMVVTDSIFLGNTANYGAGIHNYSGTFHISNSTLEDNVSEIHGGGILSAGGVLTLMNSTLSNNKANGTSSEGGGIAISGGTSVITNSTFYGNHGQYGGGISNRGDLTYINTIIAGSVGYSDCISEFGTIHSSSTHNLVEDGSCFVATNLEGDPKLGPLADNGGPTLTHALLSGSSAIDAGHNGYCTTTDQRGVSRPQGAGCDIGAYELEILVVTSIADGGNGSLRKAIADISPGGRITFSPTISGQTITLSSNLVIEKNLTIDGSDLGVPITISGNNAAGVFVISSLGNATFDSLKIINGASEYGGGIYNWANLTMINCTIANNYAQEGGGGIFNSGNAYLWLVDSILSNNTTEGDGGGIFNMGYLEVVNSTLSGNEAGANGGGIHNEGTLTVENSTLSENSAGVTGGGLHNEGTLTLLFVVLNGNEAGVGGGIYTKNSFIMTDSMLSGNSAYDGGGIYNLGNLLINNSTLFGNTATFDGGGILNVGTLNISNSTLSGNQAGQDGGGILNDDILTLLNVTLNGNSAVRHGGGIINFSGNALNFINTIIAHSTNGGDCLNNGTIHAGSTHNLVTDGSCGALLDDDPMLGPLANYGGPTWTHALLPGSPGIDAGSMAYCPGTDQRGYDRPMDGKGDGFPVCDIGAFEYDPSRDGVNKIFLPLILN